MIIHYKTDAYFDGFDNARRFAITKINFKVPFYLNISIISSQVTFNHVLILILANYPPSFATF